jgi:hypothetical protein
VDTLRKLGNMQLDQLLTGFLVQTKQFVVSRNLTVSNYYIVGLLCFATAFLFAMPVGSGDTDLWYHLNGGRLFWEFGQLPNSQFYSFMDPERTWVNYFWGFQALSYQIHNHFGYPGLIALRVGLVIITFASIATLLIRSSDRPSQRAWALVLLVLVFLVLVGRTQLIRPHLVSYMMIALFLLILERRQRWLPALPLLTVIWVNLHGVELPVGALICGAYFINAGWRWYHYTEQRNADNRRIMLWTAACLPAILLNPFGAQIVTAPFSTPVEVYDYIVELKPYPLSALFSVNFSGPTISLESAIALLSWGNLLAYGILLIRGRLQFVPLMLSLAGLLLMSRGTRFIWEWVLLSLPIWRLAIDTTQTASGRKNGDHIGVTELFVFLILLAPAFSWVTQARAFHAWPVDETNLPIGTASFLRDRNATGRMMSPPVFGGYLAWALYPKILTSGDMQTPPTLPWDHYRRDDAVRNPEALRRFVEEFRPDFIAVELSRKSFPSRIEEHSQYRPLFFDDQLALYIDAAQWPELAERYALRHTNPFNLLDAKLGTLDERITELRRMIQLDPTGDRVQHGLTRLLFQDKRYSEALPIAERFAATRPENPNSHYLLGNILENLDRCPEARAHYLAAFDVAPKSFQRVLHQHLGTCAYLTEEFKTAYRHFEKGLNPHLAEELPADLYQYAVSAFAVGDDKKAEALLNQLLYSISPEETHLIGQSKALLSDL